MAQVVVVGNLGNEFDLGTIEASKIHLKVDGATIVRDAGTGVLSAVPAGETLTTLVLSGAILNYTDEVGAVTPIDLDAVVKAQETLTVLELGGTSGTVLTYTDEDGNQTYLDLAPAIQLLETTTVLTYDAVATTLTYTDEDGNPTVIDLSGLTTDIYVNGATFDPGTMVLTLTDTDGVTPDVTVDLSALRSVITPNLAAGTWTHDDGSGTTNVIASTGAEGTNLLTIGANGGSLLDGAAITALATVDVQDAFGAHLYYAFP